MLPRLTRVTRVMVLAAGILAVTAGSAIAQVAQGVNFGFGWWFPKGESGRVPGDVLVENLNSLVFDLGEFTSFHVNGEWTLGFGHHVETAFGIGYQATSVPSYWRGYDNNGFLITQELRLRQTPLTAIVRFMPVGKHGQFQPYIGGGAGAILWRYSETGDFLDPNADIFHGNFVASGVAPAGLIVYGIKVPIRGDVFAFSVEGRYTWATGHGLPVGDFTSDRIDLGGGGLHFMFQIRY
jgi:hypothetical protein